MALDIPTWLQNGTYSARLDRLFADVLFTEGVMQVGAGQLLVSERGLGANNSVDIAAGYACITGDDIADQGKYLIRNTAPVNLAASAAPVANSRIDLVCVRINDPAEGGPAGDNAQFVYVVGVAASSPVAPAVPTSAIPLAEVLRTVGDTAVVTSDITDVRSQALTFFANTLTNAGDLLSFDGINLTRVPIGASGLPLVAGVSSVGYAQLGTTAIAAIPKVRLRRAAPQVMTTGQLVNWDTEDADTDNFIAVPANTITVPAGLGGMYAISGRLESTAPFAGDCFVAVTAATVSYPFHIPATQSAGGYSACVLLNAGEQVTVSYHGPGSPSILATLEMCRVGG